MDYVIPLTNFHKEILLIAGNYEVYILGGWSVKLNNFMLKLQNTQSKEYLDVNVPIIGAQKIFNRKRAKEIFYFNVDYKVAGTFKVNVINAKEIDVKYSNLILSNLFFKMLSKEDFSLLIRRV